MTNRTTRLKKAVQSATPGICPERALLWTAYFKKRPNRQKPMDIQIAEATRHVLRHKSVSIHPDELIVGNYCSRRVGGIIYPESHGISVLLEIFKFHKRKINPLETTRAERWRLARLIPFWLTRNIAFQAGQRFHQKIAFTVKQLTAHQYQIYEAGGISHLTPDHEKLLHVGATGLLEEIEHFQKQTTDPDKHVFYQATKIAAHALVEFGERYAEQAQKMAAAESDAGRKAELMNIAATCKSVPRFGAATFLEAVQSLLLTHIAIFQETMGESLGIGRLDQILYPYYQADLARGRLTRDRAKEILAAFSIKLCETVPVFPDILTKTLGGLSTWQVVTVGGLDRDGKDATNELSYLILEVMDELRMRQPNFHVRINPDAPAKFYDEVIRINTGLGSAPAMYNDEVIIETMIRAGYSLTDARNYVAIGCVEPTSQGKTLGSTDAAILNLPLALEMALNEGRRFGGRLRLGAKTAPVSEMTTMAEVVAAYETQLTHQLRKLHTDLQAVEQAHATWHPTPLTSLLLDGCLQKGLCSTRGGAVYNFSGIQGVGLSTVGDSLYALEKEVFTDNKISLTNLVKQLAQNLDDEKLLAYLRRLDKFGNNCAEADKWTCYAVDNYAASITALGKNTRGGKYIAGLYSNTTHVHFGAFVGALPNGRRRGEPFASGITPENGMDKQGPTALINSMNRIDFTQIANGINFNVKFDAASFADEAGRQALGSLFKVYFNRGGMQAQVNMIDPGLLLEARDNPDRYPNLLIRVSGYSAYFNDLSPQMKDEIISRSFNTV